MNNEKIICNICNKEFSRWCSLGAHVTRTHKMTTKEYYDKHIDSSLHICKECGKPTDFWTLQEGYRQFCSQKCWGVNNGKNEESKRKREETCLKKYGVKQFLASDQIQHVRLEDNPWKRPEVKAKIKETKQLRYGDPNYTNPDKNKQTKLERYGDPNYNNREKNSQTLLDHFGLDVKSPFSIPEIRKRISESLSSMTKPEKKLAEFLTNRGFEYKYGEIHNGKSFDFSIYKDGELSIIVEVDGEYFHNLTTDGIERNIPDYARFSKVPEGVKFIVCDSKKLEQCFSEILEVFDIDYEQWIKDMVSSLPKEFPYPEYTEKHMLDSWKNTCLWNITSEKNYVGHSIIRHFHKSIWKAHVGKNRSPIECWQDPVLLDKVVRNRVIYGSKLSSQKIADGFNISKIAPKVSVFRVGLAKQLVQKYLSEYETIFDPFSGFSGRMLGTCSLGKHYIGQDINAEHVSESNEIINFLKLDAEVIQKDIFQSTGNYDCLFTCSPYNLKEQWNENETDYSCDQWIDECIKRFNCETYLFVVDETNKYKDMIVETVDNNSHIGSNSEKVVLIKKYHNFNQFT